MPIALMGRTLPGSVIAARAAAANFQLEMHQRVVSAMAKRSPEWDPRRTDFWNDPRRWDDVDPHKECFWMKRRPDVIDVRSPK